MAQKILLVEDDPCFGSVLKSYLELSDYEVTLTMVWRLSGKISSTSVYWML